MLPGNPLASYSYFHCAYGFDTRRLAYVLDSLVRVSRRVDKGSFGRIFLSPLCPSPELLGQRELILPFPATVIQ